MFITNKNMDNIFTMMRKNHNDNHNIQNALFINWSNDISGV